MAADPGNYPGVGSPGQGVRWEGRLTEKKERTDEFNHKKGKHQEHFRCLNCWLVSTKTDLSRVPFFGKKKATLLFQFQAVFWCVITGLV